MLFEAIVSATSTPTHQVCPNTGAWIFPVKPEELNQEKIDVILNALILISESINNKTPVPQEIINKLKNLRG